MHNKILLVEDLDVLRETAHGILEEEGYEVTSCSNGKEGTELFKNNHYDLVITDIFMPVCDGYQFIENIKGYSKEHQQTPHSKIIAISGGNKEIMPADVMDKLIKNVSAFLKKPFPKRDFLKCVNETLTQPLKRAV